MKELIIIKVAKARDLARGSKSMAAIEPNVLAQNISNRLFISAVSVYHNFDISYTATHFT